VAVGGGRAECLCEPLGWGQCAAQQCVEGGVGHGFQQVAAFGRVERVLVEQQERLHRGGGEGRVETVNGDRPGGLQQAGDCGGVDDDDPIDGVATAEFPQLADERCGGGHVGGHGDVRPERRVGGVVGTVGGLHAVAEAVGGVAVAELGAGVELYRAGVGKSVSDVVDAPEVGASDEAVVDGEDGVVAHHPHQTAGFGRGGEPDEVAAGAIAAQQRGADGGGFANGGGLAAGVVGSLQIAIEALGHRVEQPR